MVKIFIYLLFISLFGFNCIRSDRGECHYDLGELDVTKDFPTSIQSSCNAYLSFASQNATGNSEYYNRYRKEIDWMLVQCLAYKSRVGDCNKKSDYIPKFRLYRRERKEGLDQFFYE